MDDRLLLPSTSAACVFLLDPSRRNILLNQFARPTLKVQSVINRANDTAIIQSSGALQPVWSGNQIQGTYSWRNNPGTKRELPPGQPGLSFAAAAYLPYNSIASFANNEGNLTVVAVVSGLQTGAGSGTVWSFGSTSGSPPALSLSVSSGTLSLTEVNSGGTFTASHAITSGVHVVTAYRANGSVTLRLDSAQVATHTVTAETEAFNTFTVGALVGSAVSSQLTGSLGPVAVYKGLADVYQVETYLLERYGVIRGATSGANSGF